MNVKSAQKPTGHRKRTGKSGFSLTNETRRLIKQEARSLGMSPDEYSRLTAHLFATLRKALAQKQVVDGKGLLNLVENPLFSVVIQYMAEQINKSSTDKGHEEQPTENSQNKDTAMTPRADAHPPLGTPQMPNSVVPSRRGPTPNQFPADWDYW